MTTGDDKDSEGRQDRKKRDRFAKAAFGIGALVSVLTGLAVYVFGDAFGLDAWTAQMIALVFLFVGVTDYVLLRYWDWFARRR